MYFIFFDSYWRFIFDPWPTVHIFSSHYATALCLLGLLHMSSFARHILHVWAADGCLWSLIYVCKSSLSTLMSFLLSSSSQTKGWLHRSGTQLHRCFTHLTSQCLSFFCPTIREPWALWRRSRTTWYHEDKPAGPALPAAEWVDPQRAY